MENTNTFTLKTEGYEKTVSLNFKQTQVEIPSLICYNSVCKENCDGYIQDSMVSDDKNGFYRKFMIGGIKLFLQTDEGKDVLGLFMKDGESLVIDGETLFTPNCTGDFYDRHALHLIELEKATGGAAASTNPVYFNARVNRYNMTDFDFHSSGSFPVNDIGVDEVKRMKKYNKGLYMVSKITFYLQNFINNAQENKWSEMRTMSQIAHTIAHEIFLHAYRKAFVAMRAFDNKDFELTKKIMERPTGHKGKFDHAAYIKNANDEGLNLMRSFQDSLKNIIGEKMFNDVLSQHDNKYVNLKDSKIPDSALENINLHGH